MPASKVDPAIKAAALAALYAGEQPAEVAERLQLDREVVKKWAQRSRKLSPPLSPEASPDVSPARRIVRPTLEAQQRQIGAIVLDLLRAKLEASISIAEAAQDPAWRARQSAAELAAFGEWLDRTAFALGDRLAGARGVPDEPKDADGE